MAIRLTQAQPGEALAIYDKLQDTGSDVRIGPLSRDGEAVFPVRIVGLLSEALGVVLAVKPRAQLGLQDVSVSLS